MDTERKQARHLAEQPCAVGAVTRTPDLRPSGTDAPSARRTLGFRTAPDPLGRIRLGYW